MAEVDPLTQCYEMHWTLLEGLTSFTTLIPAGNRVKYNLVGGRQPDKKEILSADVPEVRIVPGNTTYQLFKTSNSSYLSQQYITQISTGDLRLDWTKGLFPLAILVMAAYSKWPNTGLNLTWYSRKFCCKLQMSSGNNGLRFEDLQRNIKGWATMVTTTVDMYVSTADLQAIP